MNTWQFEFTQRLSYRQFKDISFEMFLSLDATTRRPLSVKLDTGSDHCIFQRYHGERLGLVIEQGMPQRFRTATGSFNAYGHEINLSVGDLEWTATVFFAEPENFPVNVVGRIGFLDHLLVAIADHEQTLYLAPLADLR
jgi:hypothetical protein